MDHDLDRIRTFVRVVERGTFSAVARELGIGQPAVSKKVAALEEHLAVQLPSAAQATCVSPTQGKSSTSR